MADAIKKFLAKLTEKESSMLLVIMNDIRAGKIKGLLPKKLSGTKTTFRVKKGVFRIIYIQTEIGYDIIDVSRRSEKTYRNF